MVRNKCSRLILALQSDDAWVIFAVIPIKFNAAIYKNAGRKESVSINSFLITIKQSNTEASQEVGHCFSGRANFC